MFQLGKRNKNKISIDYTLEDIYGYYHNLHHNDGLAVDKKLFKKITYEFNKRIMQYVTESAEEFKIPYRLGVIRIKKSKMNFKDPQALRTDWNESRKLGKTVKHLNDHTNNYKYRFFWHKSICNAKNKTAYCFETTRTLRRRLAYLLNNKITDYYL